MTGIMATVLPNATVVTE